jgi:hypothetical protein
MITRSSVLTRARRRLDQGGAVIFVVAMTLAVLASLGLYALRAASTELKTAGNDRQNAQTHYLSEYGVLGTSQEVNATTAQLYMGLMTSQPDTNCMSLAGVPGTAKPYSKTCRRMTASEIGARWAAPVLEGSNMTTTGSLGRANIEGNFFIELTEPARATQPSGYDLKLGLCFVRLTLSSTGVTYPASFPNATAKFGAAGMETGRARIVAGPIRCPQ